MHAKQPTELSIHSLSPLDHTVGWNVELRCHARCVPKALISLRYHTLTHQVYTMMSPWYRECFFKPYLFEK